MKITRRQLRRIIREEKANLNEGVSKQRESELVEAIIDLMVEHGAIDSNQPYKNGAEYLRSAVLPSLEAMAAEGGVWTDEKDYDAGFYR